MQIHSLHMLLLFYYYHMQVDAAKKRVKWLQDRLEKVLLTAKSYCHLYNRSLLKSKVKVYNDSS